jgi:hypothetical protein
MRARLSAVPKRGRGLYGTTESRALPVPPQEMDVARACNSPNKLDIQVLHIQRIFFYEFSAGFDVFTHERREDGLALGDVFQFH